MRPLPKGSSLTAIFDSCNSGTLLGNVSCTHICHPLLLISRKTSSITGATMYIGLGSTREVVGATPFETASVRRYHAPLTCHYPSSYPLVQLGRTAESRRPRARVDTAPRIGKVAPRRTSTSTTSYKGKFPRLRNASFATAGAA